MNTDHHRVITIGREFGAGGRELGQALASRLGIEYYDRALLTQAAVSSGMNPVFFERSDERAPSFISGLFSFAHGSSVMNLYAGSTPISDEAIYGHQAELIKHLANTRDCVIVGRTADYVLRGHPGLLSVFVHAPLEARVARIMRRHKESEGEVLTPAQAKVMAQKADRLRANYYNFYTDHEWGRADTYHLSFDSSVVPIAKMVDIIESVVNSR